MPTKKPRRAVIFVNPVSTSAKRAAKRIEALKQSNHFHHLEVLETSPDGAAANQKLIEDLSRRIADDTLLIVAAGDGTVSLVINTLMLSPRVPKAARNTPILPIWGGNANDLAHMLNGRAPLKNITKILHQAKVIAVKPLKCTLYRPNEEPLVKVATNYISFGASARAAQHLNQPHYRKHIMRFIPGAHQIGELFTVAKALILTPRFKLEDHQGSKLVYERIFLNGSRFARTPGVQLKLTDPQFFQVTFERKETSSLLLKIAATLRRRAPKKVKSTEASFVTRNETWVQFDGEPMLLATNTRVEIEISSQPFYALSTVL